MLSEMSAHEWAEWKAFMNLTPSGTEVDSIRFAHIPYAIWNVEIAKAQGAWDGAKRKRGKRPEFRQLHEFIVRFGDMPDYTPAPKPKGHGLFNMFKDHFESLGMKPVHR